MAEPFTVGDHEYRVRKMDVRTQFHVMRRLVAVMAPIAEDLKSAAEAPEAVMPRVADAVRSLSNEDCDFILDRCLEVVDRKDGERWVPVWNKSGRVMQYQDVDLGQLMTLAARVVMENLGGFFGGLASLTSE